MLIHDPALPGLMVEGVADTGAYVHQVRWQERPAVVPTGNRFQRGAVESSWAGVVDETTGLRVPTRVDRFIVPDDGTHLCVKPDGPLRAKHGPTARSAHWFLTEGGPDLCELCVLSWLRLGEAVILNIKDLRAYAAGLDRSNGNGHRPGEAAQMCDALVDGHDRRGSVVAGPWLRGMAGALRGSPEQRSAIRSMLRELLEDDGTVA